MIYKTLMTFWLIYFLSGLVIPTLQTRYPIAIFIWIVIGATLAAVTFLVLRFKFKL